MGDIIPMAKAMLPYLFDLFFCQLSQCSVIVRVFFTWQISSDIQQADFVFSFSTFACDINISEF